MVKAFQESFDNLLQRDSKTTAFWNSADGVLQSSLSTLGLAKKISTPVSTSVGPSVFDSKRENLYFIKYNQANSPYISIGIFDTKRKRFKNDIILNAQDEISEVILDPTQDTLFLISNTSNLLRRINLNTLAEIQNPISIPKIKKVVFHKGLNKAWIAGDTLYECSISDLAISSTPFLTNIPNEEVVDISLSNNFRDLAFITVRSLGLSGFSYQIHNLNLDTNTTATHDLYSGNITSPNAIIPKKVIAKDDEVFVLNNSLTSPGFTRFPADLSTSINRVVPLTNISQNSLKDWFFRNGNLYISHADTEPNSESEQNNVVYIYDLANNDLSSVITLPEGSISGYLINSNNELFVIPTLATEKNTIISRIDLVSNDILQSINIFALNSFNITKPAKIFEDFAFTNMNDASNGLFIFENKALDINFGQGTKVLVLDGNNPDLCTLDGIIISGGPFNISNPYVFDETEYSSITLQNDAVATYSEQDLGLILRCSKSISILDTSKIVANGLGDFGGRSGVTDELATVVVNPGAGQGPGRGKPGTLVSPIATTGGKGGSGAGHSNLGSSSLDITGGKVFGNKLFEYLEAGSGGGAGAPRTGEAFSIGGEGGRGGGSIALIAPYITLNGAIEVEGLDGETGINFGGGGGAGSGGSIFIQAINLTGSGILNTAGGLGGESLPNPNSTLNVISVAGGDGSNGRIRIDVLNDTSALIPTGDLYKTVPFYRNYSEAISTVIDTEESAPVGFIDVVMNFTIPDNFKNTARQDTKITVVSSMVNTLDYTIGNNELFVFKNGIYQVVGIDYSETTSSSITFTDPLEVGDVITTISSKDSDMLFDNPLQTIIQQPTVDGNNLILSTPYLVDTNTILVFKNGVLLSDAEYVEINYKKILLIDAPNPSDSFTVLCFSPTRFKTKSLVISGSATNLSFDYLPAADRLLIFKNGHLLPKDVYQEMPGQIRFDQTLVNNDHIIIAELKITNASLQLADRSTPYGIFQFNKSDVKELKQRYFKWKISLEASKTLTPSIDSITFDVADSVSKPYISLDLKTQSIEAREPFQLQWSTFNVTNLKLTVIPDDLSGLGVLTPTEINISSSIGSMDFTIEEDTTFILSGDSVLGPVERKIKGYVNSDSVVNNAQIHREEVTILNGQDTVTFSDTFIPQSDNLLVFQNGLLLDSGEYIKTSNSIVLNTPVDSDVIISGWAFPENYIKVESLLSSSTVTFTHPLNNTLIFNNGKLLNKEVDYTFNGNIAEFENFESGNFTAVNFNSTLIIATDVPKFSTNIFQKDIVTKKTSFSINENCVQFYKNGILLNSSDYVEDEAFSLTTNQAPSKTDIFSLVSFKIIDNHLLNDPTPPVLDEEIAVTTALQSSPGFIREDINFGETCAGSTADLVLGREEKIASSNQTTFNINSFSYTPGDKSLVVYANGLLQILGVDYTEESDTSIQFVQPLPADTKISLIKLDPALFEREDVDPISSGTDIINFSTMTYTPHNGELLVFRNGLLTKSGTDFSETLSTVITLNLPTVNDYEKLAVLDIPNVELEIQTISSSTTITASTDYDFISQQDKILVFRNGQLQILGTDYSIDGTNTITFTNALVVDQDIVSLINSVTVIPAPTQKVVLTREDQQFSGNSTFTISSFTYTPGASEILVYINGILQNSNDYTEDSSSSVTILSTLDINDQVTFIRLLSGIIEREDLLNLSIGTTVCNFSNISTSNLIVYRDGLLRRLNDDYTITSAQSITVSPATENNDFITGISLSGYEFEVVVADSSNIISTTFDFNFVNDINTVLIHKNGQLQTPGVDYTAVDNFTVSFNNGALATGDIIHILSDAAKMPCNIDEDGNPFVNTISIPILPQSKTLIFQNGLLLTQLVDYDRASDTQYTLLNPLNDPSLISIFNNHNLERQDIQVTDHTVITYVPSFSDSTNTDFLVFRNGQLQIQNADYTNEDGVITFSPSVILEDNDNLSFIRVNTSTFNIESKTAIGVNPIIPVSTPFRNGYNELLVFRNGQLLEPVEDYTEQEANFIALNFIPKATDIYNFVVIRNATQKSARYSNSLNVLDTNISFSTPFEFSSQNILVFVRPKTDNAVFKLIDYSSDYSEKENTITIPSINQGDEVSIIGFQSETIVTKERFIPVGGETNITFQTFTHSPRQQKLLVFKNGDLLDLGSDYTEIDARNIQLTDALTNSDKITLIHLSSNNFRANYESRILTSTVSNFVLDNFNVNTSALVFKDRNLLNLNTDYVFSNPYTISFNTPISSGSEITVIEPLENSQESIQGSGNTTVTFNTLSYTPGSEELLVFKNGLFQSLENDYTETSPTSVTFTASTSITDIIDVIKCKFAKRQRFDITSPTDSIEATDISSTQFCVFKNGLLQYIDKDYTQESSQKIVFNPGLLNGDIVEIVDVTDPVILLSASFNEEDYLNNTSNQTVFSLNDFVYALGNKSLLLFKNGNLLRIKKDYKENDTKSFTLNNGVDVSDEVKALGFFVTKEASVPIVTIKNFDYEVGTNELLIFIDGKFISPNIQYEEISSTELDFNLSVRELLFLNGVLQARSIDYKKAGVRDFLFNKNLLAGDQIDAIYAKLTGNIVNIQEVIDSNQSIYTLTDPYSLGAHDLLVFVNGVLQQTGIDYNELSQTSVEFISELEEGDILQFIYLSKITNYDFTETTAVDNQVIFDSGFTYNPGKVLVFSNGILQRKDLDYIESGSSIIFNSAKLDGDLIVFINIKTSDFVRDAVDLIEDNNLVSLSTTIPFLKESSINANTKIVIFKVDKEFIHRTDIYPSSSTRLLNVGIIVPRENVIVFKNGSILRQEYDYTVSNGKVVLASTASNTDQLSLIQFTDGLTIEYEEVNLTSTNSEVKFNDPFRNNTFDYWVFYNGTFLTKDLFYNEVSANSIQFKNMNVQVGDLISKVNFKFNERVNVPALTFNHVVDQNEPIFADDYSQMVDKINIIAKAYGIKPVHPLLDVSIDDKLIGDDTLTIKNILKLANTRENSVSDFTLVDNRIFENRSYTSDLANNLKDIINETLTAKPNTASPCLSAMEGNFPTLRGPGLKTATLSFLTDNPTILGREEQISTLNQTVVSLNEFTYTPGQNELMVFINGVLQTVSLDYSETTNSDITLSSPLPTGERITLIKTDITRFTREDFINPSGSSITFSSITHTPSDNLLHFFRNGLLQAITTDYTETSNNSVSVTPTFISDEVANGILTPDLDYEIFTIGSGEHNIVSNKFDVRALGSKLLVFRNGQLQITGQDFSTSGKKVIVDSTNKWNAGDVIIVLGDKIVKKIFTTFYPFYDSLLDSDFNTSSLQYFENEEDVVISTNGQTQVSLSSFTYTPNTKQILVFYNDKILNKGIDYTETNTNEITLAISTMAGDIVKIIRLDINLSNQDVQTGFASNTTAIFTNFVFDTGNLLVFKNGSLLEEGTDYNITSTQSYDLTQPIGSSDVILNILLENALVEMFNVTSGTQDQFITTSIRVTAPTLFIFKDGKLLNQSDYSIIDSQTIKLNTPAIAPSAIQFVAPTPDFSNLEADELDLRLINETDKISLTRETQIVNIFTQSIFGIKTFEFKLGSNNLQVFKNGLIQIRGIDYIEINPNTIKFVNPLLNQDRVDFVLYDRGGLMIADVLKPTAGINTLNTTIPFTVNNHEILVWRNGVLQNNGTDYTESLDLLTFSTVFGSSEEVKILYLNNEFTFDIQTVNGDSDIISLTTPITISGLQLQVYRNGLLQTPGLHYMETGVNEIQFISGNLESNDIVTLVTVHLGTSEYHIGSLRDVRIGACVEGNENKYIDNTVYMTFDASSLFIKPGDEVILEWDTENADSVILSDIGSVDVNGKVIVKPFVTTLYTLAASNSQDQVTKNILVKVIDPPTGSFSASLSLLSTSDPQVTISASSNNVIEGNSVTLSYNAENIISLEIDNGIGSVPIPSGSIDIIPDKSTIYTITAIGANNQVVHASVPVFVQNVPVVTFGATKTTIKQGESTDLNWELLNTNSFTIDNGINAPSQSVGSISTGPLNSTITYTLAATNSVGTTTKTVTITVVPATPDASLSVDRTIINPGQSTTLSWNLNNYDNASIDQGIGSISTSSGSIPVSPTTTTTYTLTANNGAGTTTQSITVQVQPGPKINFFGASSGEILVGQEVNLSWSTSNSSSAFISGVGEVSLSGTKKVKITQEKTVFVLTAGNNSAGQVTKEITIIAKSKPSVDYFNASTDFAHANDTVTLKWATRNATKVSIDQGIGEVSVIGEKQVSLNTNKTYILTVENDYATVTQELKVSVAPKIHVFLTEKTEAQLGEQVRIIWQTIGADKVEISGIGPVSKTGSRKITVLQTTSVKITATNGVSSESKEILIKLIE